MLLPGEVPGASTGFLEAWRGTNYDLEAILEDLQSMIDLKYVSGFTVPAASAKHVARTVPDCERTRPTPEPSEGNGFRFWSGRGRLPSARNREDAAPVLALMAEL